MWSSDSHFRHPSRSKNLFFFSVLWSNMTLTSRRQLLLSFSVQPLCVWGFYVFLFVCAHLHDCLCLPCVCSRPLFCTHGIKILNLMVLSERNLLDWGFVQNIFSLNVRSSWRMFACSPAATHVLVLFYSPKEKRKSIILRETSETFIGRLISVCFLRLLKKKQLKTNNEWMCQFNTQCDQFMGFFHGICEKLRAQFQKHGSTWPTCVPSTVQTNIWASNTVSRLGLTSFLLFYLFSGGVPHTPILPYNPLYTHLTPDSPQCSHTLSSQVLAAADLSTNTCWGQLNLCTPRRKNTSMQDRKDTRAGGGGGRRRGRVQGQRRMRNRCVCVNETDRHSQQMIHEYKFIQTLCTKFY